jgi:GNAT superfamily N-acetyltransferase
MEHASLRRLEDTDASAASAVLTRAFHDNALFCTVMPDPEERTRMTHAIFTASLRHACRYGEAWAYAAGDAIQGVAYWVIRPEPQLSDLESAELGFSDVAARWGRALEVLGAMERDANAPFADLPTPWRYLAAVGVDPAYQGHGVGTVLVAKVIADARAAGQQCGVVTDGARNVPLYQRCGFALIRDALGSDGTTRLWTLLTDSPSELYR